MTRGKIVRVPNQPATPKRSIRIPDAIWHPARANAQQRGEDVATIVRAALEKYNKRCARENRLIRDLGLSPGGQNQVSD